MFVAKLILVSLKIYRQSLGDYLSLCVCLYACLSVCVYVCLFRFYGLYLSNYGSDFDETMKMLEPRFDYLYLDYKLSSNKKKDMTCVISNRGTWGRGM